MDVYGTGEMKEAGIAVQNGEGRKPAEVVNEERGIQAEAGEIMKIAKELGAKGNGDIFTLINRLSGLALTDWRMTKAEAKAVLSALLAEKHRR
jgi:hypothetical protein